MSISYARAPIVDETLAELMAGEKDPVEGLADAVEFRFHPGIHTGSVEDLLSRGRLVKLECGHFKLTKAMRRTGCPRCGEMIRSGWDHDGFRRLGSPDSFSWPGDPLRKLHERDALEHSRRFDPTAGG